MPYGTGSVSMYLQRIGRGLRTYKDKTHCDVYIGSVDPKVEQGQWEAVQKAALKAGGKEEVEIPYTAEQVAAKVLTLEVMKMTRALREKKMDELAGMLENRRFPSDLLGHLASVPPVTQFNPRAKASKKQKELIGSKNIRAENLSMNEAATIIDGMATTKNWKKAEKIVPSGKFEGQPLSRVPFVYRTMVKNAKGKYYNQELSKLFGGK